MSSRIPGLSAIAPRYKGVLSDIWGVLHNGVHYNEDAVQALTQFRKEVGPVVLITNAPRPSGPIREQLDGLNVPHACYDDIVTSGDVTRDALAATGKSKLLHIGPERDFPLYEGLGLSLVGEEEAEIICCTGLFDDNSETPDDYDEMLQSLAKRQLPFICANPDRVVDKGGKMLYCAGALADRFEAYGGETFLVGKPQSPIYDASIAALNRANGNPIDKSGILIIGDSLPTDMRGGHYQKIDSLFITAGIHAEDFGPADTPDDSRVTLRLGHEDVDSIGFMTRLAW
ncbi:TIGR01459 family HAD-type hydrolase [Cohaesibacter celericrescens]|uniref:TIGR01459 family HAD-type hydrolase n=1 Tax=Cohaesibacter celericrescens TaxID=2067669 RepID=A0A2N5XL73_9HYPH|nr:TIGR01459 family HAD-type hydrolase [Cohaesibacter celericrescens]PLW75180.1 TIGR01459 family HAD-type hydrolase [Cohaesibacter celericrescens]